MAYVERGVVKDKRTIWRLSIISDFFRAIVNFIRMFFLTMFSIEKTDGYRKGYGSGKKWDGGPGGGGPGGGSGRGPYGGSGGGGGGPRGPRTLSDIRSNDQSKEPRDPSFGADPCRTLPMAPPGWQLSAMITGAELLDLSINPDGITVYF
uniref:Selenoprotein K n=1 Tax=Oryza punctata TaxID=4537 RepID=A0A0E0KBL7_ORYPU